MPREHEVLFIKLDTKPPQPKQTAELHVDYSTRGNCECDSNFIALLIISRALTDAFITKIDAHSSYFTSFF